MNNSAIKLWSSNPRKLFDFRLNRMRVGDALVSSSSDWRVDCVRDDSNPENKMYVIYRNGKQLFTKKRPAAVIKYLVAQRAPHDLEIVENQALFSMSGYQNFRVPGITSVFIDCQMKVYDAVIKVVNYFVGDYGNISIDSEKYLEKSALKRKAAVSSYPETAFFYIEADEFEKDTLDEW